jgi:hypothetical protein
MNTKDKSNLLGAKEASHVREVTFKLRLGQSRSTPDRRKSYVQRSWK